MTGAAAMTVNGGRSGVLGCGAMLVAAFVLAGAAQARTAEECEKLYKPDIGQPGKDVVWVPTPDDVVTRLLRLAKVSSRDYVIDLGAGDGKIAIAAAKQFGARSHGIEYNPDMVKLANCMVEAAGMHGRTRILHGDIFREDFSRASVVTMYLLPELNLCVRHRLLAMKPGTRVASHQFTMGDWKPDSSRESDNHGTLLWIVPARVAGTWRFEGESEAGGFSVRLRQSFQQVTGTLERDGGKQPLKSVRLRGDELGFSFEAAGGALRHFSGRVRGASLEGRVQADGAGPLAAKAKRVGRAPAAAWAQMAPDCGKYYSEKS